MSFKTWAGPKFKKYKNIFLAVFFGVLVFFTCQALIYYYIYPGVLPDKFLASVNTFVSSFQKQPPKTIVVNLRNMVLDTFENGDFRKRYPVIAAGNPRISPTPTGNFQVLAKHKNVFSSLSHVWMPWSMRFYRGYYIHEVPYYKSGAKVKTRYSLGCLRFRKDDAQEIYEWADLGIKVQIVNARLAREEDKDTVYYLTQKGSKRPMINEEVFLSYGNKWSDVAVVLSGQLAAYSDVELIRAKFDFKVYKLEKGQKRWITDIETFKALDYKWEEITPVNETELIAWPTGSPIKIIKE